MRRPILWRLENRQMIPIYGVGPWWMHAIYWVAGHVTDTSIQVQMWCQNRLREESRDA